MKGVVIFSGGLDSTTVLFEAVARLGIQNVEAVSFAYGQRHARELVAARLITKRELITHHVVDLGGIPYMGMAPAEFMRGGALTGGAAVPHGHYEAPTMKATVVPNRNMIFISIAAARLMQLLGEHDAFGELYIGVHAGDHEIYPDCREEFVGAMYHAIEEMSYAKIELIAPYQRQKKWDIVCRGTTLKVPYADTWSCYEGGELHCGKCGTCVERREAFTKAYIEDPTAYAA